MVKETLTNIFKYTWPMMLIFLSILLSLRLAWLIKNKQKIVLYKELIGLFFVIYILCLFHIVSFQDVSWSTQNYIPFREILRYEVGTGLFFKNILGNTILFIPYGFFASYYLKLVKLRTIVGLTIFTSFIIEFTQSKIGRVFDIDDIILNVTGGIVGFLLYKLLDYLKDHLPKVFKKHMILNIIIILLIIIFIFYLINLYIFEVI
ncbi:MAG: VanZ family protein [Bacilli bacterium]